MKIYTKTGDRSYVIVCINSTGMGCAANLAVVVVIAAEPVGPTPVVVEEQAAVEVADHPTPVGVATAQVEGPTVPSSAVVAGERAVPNLAAAKERVDEREDTESRSHFRFIFGCYSSLRKV